MTKELLYLAIPLSCLFAALIAGFFGAKIGRSAAHRVAIAGVGLSFLLSLVVAVDVFSGNVFNGTIYTWATSGSIRFEIGFLLDQLSVVMIATNRINAANSNAKT